MTDIPFESFKPSRRSQSAIPANRSNIHRKYHEYLKKLQEKKKLSNQEHNSKDDHLKQRENGFQLYINGAHSLPPRRPPSVLRKRTENSSNRIQTPSPFFSKNAIRRRRWSLTAQTKIKTEQGSIIADIDSQISPSNNQITYRLNTDQSWMPDWYSQKLSLSLDDIPTSIRLTESQQKTYRLSTMVGR